MLNPAQTEIPQITTSYKQVNVSCSANSATIGGYYGTINQSDVADLVGKVILLVTAMDADGYPAIATYRNGVFGITSKKATALLNVYYLN